MQELEKIYDPRQVEAQAMAIWEKGRYFHADATAKGPKGTYAIVIPPPNVTAALHLGHALNNTLQDILIRMRRMQGFNTLWMPGTDHAGIATQTVVEKRLLAEQGKRRTDFGREEFVGHVQSWKDEYEGRILGQLKSMGCSCDWERTRFTMDEMCANAVRTNFFNLFKDGLIYRGKRLVNWDPATQTVLADDEVEHQTVQGFFWYLQYPLETPVCVEGVSPSKEMEDAGKMPATQGISKRNGRYLPHWSKEGATYAVVFRLADSVPREISEQWRFQRRDIIEHAQSQGRPLTENEEKELQRLYSEKIESFLNAGYGECLLEKDDIAETMDNALKHFDGERYDLLAWAIMPNHMHIIVKPHISHKLDEIVHSWKSFTAKEINRHLGREGSVWMEEYYDHLIRDDNDFNHQVNYVISNPEKAGLQNWKWYGRKKDRGQDARDTIEYITVATTRPETMLGDTAVAMNPNDPRAKFLVGKMVRLPIVGRLIPIVADEHVVLPNADSKDEKAKFSTGFLKVTPAHDPDDWQIGLRHDLAVINIMAPDGSISDKHGWTDATTPEAQNLVGMDRFEAREAIVEWFRQEKLLEQVRDYAHEVGHSYRSHVPIEPYLSDQWYVAVKKPISNFKFQISNLKCETEIRDNVTYIKDTDVPVNSLAGLALTPLLDGKLKFYPDRYGKTYQTWLENLRDWPISRQLWWGHQIPVWTLVLTTAHHQSEFERDDAYIERYEALLNDFLSSCQIKEDVSYYKSERLIDGFYPYYICAKTSKAQQALDYLSERYQHHSTSDMRLVKKWKSVNDRFKELFGQEAFKCANEIAGKILSLSRDEDVLDTWFSSALWPFSTLGWPEATAELKTFYPTQVLCTAREIITLWVSRMVMMGQYCVGDIPFSDVYIHAMIQDGQGRKMSKSLGNGIDPLVAIDSHGADAMRFTLASMTTDTQDVRMPVAALELPDGRTVNSSPKFDLGRSFCNKLWNASRFAMMNLEGTDPAAFDASKLDITDRWILSRLARTIKAATESLGSFKFNEPINELYRFFWNDFCDWYLEWSKPRMMDDRRPIAQNVLAFVLDQILRLLHPFVPFITEGIYQNLNTIAPRRGLKGIADLSTPEALLIAPWPVRIDGRIDEPCEKQIDLLQNIIRALRDIRSQYNIPMSKPLTVSASAPQAACQQLTAYASLIGQLAGVAEFKVSSSLEKPGNSAAAIVEDIQLFVHDVIDPAAERQRLQKQKEFIESGLRPLQAKIGNENFISRAKPEVVEQTRQKMNELAEQLAAVNKHLSEL